MMNNGKLKKVFLMGFIACFSFLICNAQPVLKTSFDKSEILIGEQFNIKIAASFLPEEYKINWPVIPDSLQHFEVVARSKVDSLYNNDRLTGLVQTLTLTSFDSGKWILPSFLVNISPVKDDTTYNLFTDSLPVTVSFSTADTTNQLRDIKPIREVEVKHSPWFWIASGILLIALVLLLMWVYRRWKKNKVVVPHRTKTTAYDEALKELGNLKTYNLSSPQEIKIVHTRLGEILKRYLSRTQATNYLNKTTGNLLMVLRDNYPNETMITKAAAILRCGDAVKFAKYLPPVNESEECLQLTKELIDEIQQQTQSARPTTINTKP